MIQTVCVPSARIYMTMVLVFSPSAALTAMTTGFVCNLDHRDNAAVDKVLKACTSSAAFKDTASYTQPDAVDQPTGIVVPDSDGPSRI